MDVIGTRPASVSHAWGRMPSWLRLMEALSSLLCGPLFGKGHLGRLGFENAGGCLPPEGGPTTREKSQLKVPPKPMPVTFLLGPLKTPHKKTGVACVPIPCTFRTNIYHAAGPRSAVWSLVYIVGLSSAPRNPGPIQPRGPPPPWACSCHVCFCSFLPLSMWIGGPGCLSLGSKCTCRRSWPFTSVHSRKPELFRSKTSPILNNTPVVCVFLFFLQISKHSESFCLSKWSKPKLNYKIMVLKLAWM